MAAQDLSQKSSRLSLDVRLKAPVIIVPQSSRSQNAVVIDLGKLRVTNSFQILSQKDSAGLPAVLDIMTVELTLMKVFRYFELKFYLICSCIIQIIYYRVSE